MAETEEKVISIIKSCLAISKAPLTVDQLESDYKQLIGTKIPYKKFQHGTLISFLQSATKDFKLKSSYGNLCVEALHSESTQHIEKLVKQQKCTAKSKQRIPRRLSDGPKRWIPPRPMRRNYRQSYGYPYSPNFTSFPQGPNYNSTYGHHFTLHCDRIPNNNIYSRLSSTNYQKKSPLLQTPTDSNRIFVPPLMSPVPQRNHSPVRFPSNHSPDRFPSPIKSTSSVSSAPPNPVRLAAINGNANAAPFKLAAINGNANAAPFKLAAINGNANAAPFKLSAPPASKKPMPEMNKKTDSSIPKNDNYFRKTNSVSPKDNNIMPTKTVSNINAPSNTNVNNAKPSTNGPTVSYKQQLKQLAKQLGFDDVIYSSSPGGGGQNNKRTYFISVVTVGEDIFES